MQRRTSNYSYLFCLFTKVHVTVVHRQQDGATAVTYHLSIILPVTLQHHSEFITLCKTYSRLCCLQGKEL